MSEPLVVHWLAVPAVAQLVPPMPSVVRTFPLVPRVAGKVRLDPVPFPLMVKEPPIVVFPFFRIKRASLLVEMGSPFPITKRRSVDTKLLVLPVPIVAK